MNKPQIKFSRRMIMKMSAAMSAITLAPISALAIVNSRDPWQLVTTHEPDHARIVFASHHPLKMGVASIHTSAADVHRADAIFVLADNDSGTQRPLPDEIYAAHRNGVLTGVIRAPRTTAASVMSDIARLYSSDETVFRCADLEDMRLILNSTCGNDIPVMVAACATGSGENAVSDSLAAAMQQIVATHGATLAQVERLFIIVGGKRQNLRLDNVYRAYSFLLAQFARKAWVLYGAIYDDALEDRIRTTLMIGV